MVASDPETQAHIILDSFMNRFDGNMDDRVSAGEIEKRLVSEGADEATAKAVAAHALSNWDSGREDVGGLFRGRVCIGVCYGGAVTT